MNKKLMFGAVAALALPLVSCQEEVEGVRTGMVDYTISAGLPTALGTYASNQGGLNNVNDSEYDLKYTMEVWKGNEVVYSTTKEVDENFSQPVNFNVRLAATQYKFVFFAEFITEDGVSVYDLSNGLDEIKLTQRAYGSEVVDAYYKCEDIDLSQASVAKSITLKRKFGKIRLLATDEVANTNAVAPAKAVVTYGQAEVPSTFNALTGEVATATLPNAEFTYEINQTPETVTINNTEMTAYVVGFDYILPSGAQTAYSFNIQLLDAAGNQIGYREVSNIPVQENKLTTVYGNFYSNEGDLTVSVDDAFENIDIELSEPIVVSPDMDLAKMVAEAPAGATIQLVAGEYACPNGLLIGKPVKIVGAPNHESVVLSASDAWTTIWLKGDVAGTTIDGLKVYSAYKNNLGGFAEAISVWGTGTEDAPITIKNCVIEKPAELDPTVEGRYLGISSTYGDFQHFVIDNNEINDANYGMYLCSVSNSVISNNTVNNTRRGGIVIGADGGEQYKCANVQVTGNTLTEISRSGKNAVYDYALSVAGAYGENITESNNNVTYASTANAEIAKVNAYGFDLTTTGNLAELVKNAADGATIRLAAGTTYTGNVTIGEGKNITIIGADDMTSKIAGQITTTNAGVVVKNVVIEGTSYGLYAEGGASMEAVNCVFNITPNEGNTNTAVMTWTWKGDHKKVHLTNCVFNAEGARTVQLRQVADAKIEGCTFNTPYTYAVQLDETSNNLVFNNNTINNAQSAIYVHYNTTASSVAQSGNVCNNVIYPFCARPQALNDATNKGMDEFWYYVTESDDNKNNFAAVANKPGRTVALAGSFTKQISLSAANNNQNIYGPNWNINPTTNEAALKTNWTVSSQIKFAYDNGNKTLENITLKGLYIAGGYMNQQYGGLKNVTVENCAFVGNTTSTNGFIAHQGTHAATEGLVVKNNLFRYTEGSASARVMLWGSNDASIEFSNNKLDKAYLHFDGKVNAKVANNLVDVTGLDMIYNVLVAGGSADYVREFTNNTYKGASFCAYYLYNGAFEYGKNIKTSGDSYYGTPNLFGLRGASIDSNNLTFTGYSAAIYR